jgi:hypothetical protein
MSIDERIEKLAESQGKTQILLADIVTGHIISAGISR